ncbi:MAG: tetratricopeptide repeat protein, partial [Myxococcota bacterium]
AGNAAVGPFRVSGTIGGWLPNPGLIEGIAVAIEWPERDGMTPHQYCRALKEMDRLPRLDDLMGLSFLSLPASQAYTGAGSFVRWLLDTRGPEVVREMHRSGTVASLGEDMETLEAAWRASLDEVVLPPGALDLAELRFARSSIFQSTCPHALARLRRELGADLAAGDHARVVATCDELLAIEPAELSALVTRPGALARMGDLDAAVAALEAVEGAPPPLVWRARERVADARWIRGQRSSALDTYRELLRGAQSDGDARQREVKSLAIGSGGPQERLIRDLLVGPQGRGVNSTVAVHLAREIDRFRGDGLGRYLEARQLMAQGRYDLALPSIEEAERRGLPTERIRDEALRMIAITLFATGDLSRSEQRWREALERPRLRNMAEEWLDRIEFHRR